jgi:hypothetical protein
MFLSSKARRVFPDWPEIAAQTVAVLRANAGHGPQSASLTALVNELITESEHFGLLWEEYEVSRPVHGTHRLLHDTVGLMTINYQSLILPAEPELSLVLYTADVGSLSEEKLSALVETACADKDRQSVRRRDRQFSGRRDED